MVKYFAERVFVALLIVAFAGQAFAGLPGEVSHSAMGGSTLMETTAQFNSWTHWITNYESFVELSVGDDEYSTAGENFGRGQATLHWKYSDTSHLLFRVRQFDLGGQNTNFVWGGTLERAFMSPASLVDLMGVSNYNAYTEGQMLNLAWAKPLSGGGAFSIGLIYADAGEKATDPADEFNDKSGAFGGQVTWGNGGGLDLAGSFNSQSATFGDTDAEDKGSLTQFDVTARLATDSGWIYQFGGLMGSGSVEDFGDPTTDVSTMGLLGNAGRHLVQSEQTDVTAEFYLNYYSLGYEDDTDENTQSTFTIPGTRVAVKTTLSKYFELMAGANAFWSNMEDKLTATGGELTESERGMMFSYHGGLAYTPGDNVRIEGQLHMDELNQILTFGNTTAMLLRVGGTVMF